MGINALVVSVSAAAGPTIAAGILSVGNWPWLFAINIPIGITALILSFKFLPQNPVKAVGRKFDVTAALMNALTFGLVIAIIEAFTHDVHISLIIAAIVIVLFCGYFYIRREERQAYPLLPIDLLRIPPFYPFYHYVCVFFHRSDAGYGLFPGFSCSGYWDAMRWRPAYY